MGQAGAGSTVHLHHLGTLSGISLHGEGAEEVKVRWGLFWGVLGSAHYGVACDLCYCPPLHTGGGALRLHFCQVLEGPGQRHRALGTAHCPLGALRLESALLGNWFRGLAQGHRVEGFQRFVFSGSFSVATHSHGLMAPQTSVPQPEAMELGLETSAIRLVPPSLC